MLETKTRNRNNINLKDIRQKLRKNLSAPETILWSKLKSKQLGVKFRRQYGVANYILDFYCSTLKLAIEIDGNSHYDNDALLADKSREDYLKSINIKVLRFTNPEITDNLNGVIIKLSNYINNHTTPNPS
jgi:very-short-patch-repair endonuclease